MRPLRIGTWNAEHAPPGRLTRQAQVLETNPADIWVLTETHDDLRPPSLPHELHSRHRPSHAQAVRPGSRFVSIWSRHPITKCIELEGADLERSVIAQIDWAGRDLIVFGVVIPWLGAGAGAHDQAIMRHCAEWLELRRRFPAADLIVAGDFNSDLGAQPHWYGTNWGKRAIKNGLAEAGLICPTAPDALPPGKLANPPVDHVAIPKSWEAHTSLAAAWPAQPSLSDHSGLVLEARP